MDFSKREDGHLLPFTVTDFRADDPPGVYFGDKLVVPGIHGTGICLLSDGSALVTQHGQSDIGPFHGRPGALIYIPASMMAKP